MFQPNDKYTEIATLEDFLMLKFNLLVAIENLGIWISIEHPCSSNYPTANIDIMLISISIFSSVYFTPMIYHRIPFLIIVFIYLLLALHPSMALLSIIYFISKFIWYN